MRIAAALLLCSMIVLLGACAPNPFVSSWRAPDAQPLQLDGARVAAVVMMKNTSSRRAAEDALAQRISELGGQGVALYAVAQDVDPANEAAVRAAAEQAGVQGVVVMRPTDVSKEIVSTPVMYTTPTYSGFWGGYYPYGWGSSWAFATGGDIRTDTVVSVETLVYSLPQNRLVWAGKSRTTNPRDVEALIEKISVAGVKELRRQGLLSL